MRERLTQEADADETDGLARCHGSTERRDTEVDAVLMTGYPEVETAVQALRLGAYDYLMKPMDWVSLQHVLKRIVERRYLQALYTPPGYTSPHALMGQSASCVQIRR